MLTINRLSKQYRKKWALRDVSLSVHSSNITSIVGSNGTGKTTLLSILAGIVKPTSGEISMDGSNAHQWRRSDVGFVSSELFYFERLAGLQMLSFERTMRRIVADDDEIWCALDRWGAGKYALEPMGRLSQGMRKQIMMACAFLGQPKLLILDEPLNGLDAHGIIALKDQLECLRKKGSYILMSSHVLDFVQDCSDEVFLLNQGTIVGQMNCHDESLEEAYRREYFENE